MSVASVNRLSELILSDSSELLADWRKQVRALPAARLLDRPTLDDHIPQLLEEIAEALREHRNESIAAVMLEGTPPAHGLLRLDEGFDLAEVVAEYNILRGVIHDLAERNGIAVRGETFHILNRVLDTAIGLAVQTYATQRALEVKQRREEYLAFVAHDLRSPLNAVSLTSKLLEMLLADKEDDPRVTQALAALARNVRQMEELVAMVLKENTVEAGQIDERLARRQIDLWPLVESVLRDLDPVAQTNNTEQNNTVPTELSVYADAGMLRRILHNLVSNAIRYTPRGKVTVHAKSLADGSMECFVSDNGSGIPPERLEKVFDKFATDADQSEGVGLGLAIVKEFVEAHGGNVGVRSQAGQGTVFHFTLPAKTR